jgi:nucleoside-diphosphate-sugar epimerase
MKVVVPGASGFLGRNFLLRTPRDWRVTALYHHTTDLPAFLTRHQLSHVEARRCDLLASADVQRVAEAVDGRADAVMYFAANGDPAASHHRPRWDLESNATALVNFLEHCPADHLVYVSSGAVYDGLTDEVTPATALAPRLPYAISKLAAEQYARFFSERRGTPGSYINVRFFGAYGPYEAERKITTRWLRGMTRGQREFVIRGDGRNLIDFMYVDDAIDGFLALVNARGVSLTVDFASGTPISVNDVVAAMASGLGVDVTIRHEGTVPEYIQFRTVDPTMRERFGVRPKVSFAEGFKRFADFLVREDRVAG